MVVEQMTGRSVHYESALEDYLRSRGTPYIAVDESRRVIFAGARIKSFDFLIYPSTGPSLIADVKGRKFPYQSGSSNRYWENWVTQGDLDGLSEWEQVFGKDYRAVLVFAYLLTGPEERWPTGSVHPFRENYYAFLVAPVAEYRAHARTRSTKWRTVSVSVHLFRQMVRPLSDALEGKS